MTAARRAVSYLSSILAVVGAVFATGLRSGFVFDDYADILANPAARPTSFLSSIAFSVRPLLKTTYALNALFSDSAPSYRIVNILLHLVATALVWMLLLRWLRIDDDFDVGVLPATIGAALWGLHPSAVESVTYVSGRSVGLSTVLLLAALLFATRQTGRRSALAAGLCAFLAPLARETAIILPALLALWQVTLARPESRVQILRRHSPVWLGTLASMTLLVLMPRHRELVAFSLQSRPPLEALRGNVRALVQILSFYANPSSISIDPLRPEEFGWSEPETFLPALGILASSLAVVLARRRLPILSFALGWTLLNLLPTNSVIWRLDPVSARPLYLASLAPVLVLAFLSRAVLHASPRWRPLVVTTSLLLASGFAYGMVSRNHQYRSPVSLWEDAVLKAPLKGRPHANLGFAHLEAGDIEAARRELSIALDREPWDRKVRCGLKAIAGERQAMNTAIKDGSE